MCPDAPPPGSCVTTGDLFIREGSDDAKIGLPQRSRCWNSARGRLLTNAASEIAYRAVVQPSVNSASE